MGLSKYAMEPPKIEMGPSKLEEGTPKIEVGLAKDVVPGPIFTPPIKGPTKRVQRGSSETPRKRGRKQIGASNSPVVSAEANNSMSGFVTKEERRIVSSSPLRFSLTQEKPQGINAPITLVRASVALGTNPVSGVQRVVQSVPANTSLYTTLPQEQRNLVTPSPVVKRASRNKVAGPVDKEAAPKAKNARALESPRDALPSQPPNQGERKHIRVQSSSDTRIEQRPSPAKQSESLRQANMDMKLSTSASSMPECDSHTSGSGLIHKEASKVKGVQDKSIPADGNAVSLITVEEEKKSQTGSSLGTQTIGAVNTPSSMTLQVSPDLTSVAVDESPAYVESGGRKESLEDTKMTPVVSDKSLIRVAAGAGYVSVEDTKKTTVISDKIPLIVEAVVGKGKVEDTKKAPVVSEKNDHHVEPGVGKGTVEDTKRNPVLSVKSHHFDEPRSVKEPVDDSKKSHSPQKAHSCTQQSVSIVLSVPEKASTDPNREKTEPKEEDFKRFPSLEKESTVPVSASISSEFNMVSSESVTQEVERHNLDIDIPKPAIHEPEVADVVSGKDSHAVNVSDNAAVAIEAAEDLSPQVPTAEPIQTHPNLGVQGLSNEREICPDVPEEALEIPKLDQSEVPVLTDAATMELRSDQVVAKHDEALGDNFDASVEIQSKDNSFNAEGRDDQSKVPEEMQLQVDNLEAIECEHQSKAAPELADTQADILEHLVRDSQRIVLMQTQFQGNVLEAMEGEAQVDVWTRIQVDNLEIREREAQSKVLEQIDLLGSNLEATEREAKRNVEDKLQGGNLEATDIDSLSMVTKETLLRVPNLEATKIEPQSMVLEQTNLHGDNLEATEREAEIKVPVPLPTKLQGDKLEVKDGGCQSHVPEQSPLRGDDLEDTSRENQSKEPLQTQLDIVNLETPVLKAQSKVPEMADIKLDGQASGGNELVIVAEATQSSNQGSLSEELGSKPNEIITDSDQNHGSVSIGHDAETLSYAFDVTKDVGLLLEQTNSVMEESSDEGAIDTETNKTQVGGASVIGGDCQVVTHDLEAKTNQRESQEFTGRGMDMQAEDDQRGILQPSVPPSVCQLSEQAEADLPNLTDTRTAARSDEHSCEMIDLFNFKLKSADNGICDVGEERRDNPARCEALSTEIGVGCKIESADIGVCDVTDEREVNCTNLNKSEAPQSTEIGRNLELDTHSPEANALAGVDSELESACYVGSDVVGEIANDPSNLNKNEVPEPTEIGQVLESDKHGPEASELAAVGFNPDSTDCATADVTDRRDIKVTVLSQGKDLNSTDTGGNIKLEYCSPEANAVAVVGSELESADNIIYEVTNDKEDDSTNLNKSKEPNSTEISQGIELEECCPPVELPGLLIENPTEIPESVVTEEVEAQLDHHECEKVIEQIEAQETRLEEAAVIYPDNLGSEITAEITATSEVSESVNVESSNTDSILADTEGQNAAIDGGVGGQVASLPAMGTEDSQ
ncbi:uncharacterized protein LOC110006868 [Amborella trichopoda]|nr:uncharacterized protein LOC110006868 [Amborella trichopoda]|eukprot:XP_020520276.1 uncharacterized protein LOC110006868 [Amborella trichopoda]